MIGMFHLLLTLLLEPVTALAQIDCPVNSLGGNGFQLSCWGAGGGGFGPLATVIGNLNGILSNVFAPLVFLMTVVYSLGLIIGSTDENSITEGRRAFLFALAGGFVIMFKMAIWDAVNPGGGAIVDLGPLLPVADRVRTYVSVAGAAAAIGFVTVRAVRLMTAGSDDGVISSQRKLFLNAIVGVGLLLLADSIVKVALGEGTNTILSEEIIGIGNYILYILGALVVLSIVFAGFMLIISYDEGLQERAKKTIFNAVIVLIVIVCLEAILNFVLS